MQVHQIIVLFVSVFCFIKTNESCSVVKTEYDSLMTCFSLKQVSDAGYHPEWKNLTVLKQENETMQVLPNDLFKKFPNLNKLTINGVANKIEPYAFRGLNQLQMLELINNDIKQLEEMKFMNHLHLFRVKNSNLEAIPGYYFSQMDNLRFLDLSDNKINYIGDCALCNLEKTYIILANNSLKSFEPERILGNTSMIMGLNLDYNQLTTIKRFGKMSQLIGTSFVNNSIETIESGTYLQVPFLRIFNVAFNKLKEIPANIFADTKTHAQLFITLNNNKIKCLSQNLREKIRNLQRIVVDNNPWNCQCFDEIVKWVKSLNAFIGCENIYTCEVSCFDEKGDLKNMQLYSLI